MSIARPRRSVVPSDLDVRFHLRWLWRFLRRGEVVLHAVFLVIEVVSGFELALLLAA